MAAGADAPAPLTRRRYAVFLAITLATPLLLLVGVEGVLRVVRPRGGLPLFVPAGMPGGGYVVASPGVGARWFPTESLPPAPMFEPFRERKHERGVRIFALGESSTAGFPYPRNGAFSRLVRDALRDVLPADSVEVINLGIAATNSYAMLDVADEVLAHRPDAVLIYAGHNEYYGTLGPGSASSVFGAWPPLVRAYLRLLRLRTVLATRDGMTRVVNMFGRRRRVEEASLMEALARDRQIELHGASYRLGARQFEENLVKVIRRCRSRGVAVFVASVASNLREQPPFASPGNTGTGGASAVYGDAGTALARGDTVRARELFARARDLDVVRFRAPGEFTAIVRRVAAATGATYVPVEEAFAAASPGGIPGGELFLEHVHPNRRGYALIGRLFVEAIRDAGLLGREARLDRLRSWEEYERGMELTPFDERIAVHTTRTLRVRWPFVPIDRQQDYRATYRSRDQLDSLAFLVSRGIRWESAKLELAAAYERRGLIDSALAEYRGLVRDAPFFEEPLRLQGRALLAAGREPEGESVLRRALRLRPTAYTTHALGVIALRRKEFTEAIALLRQSLALVPDRPETLYQLSLAYGMSRDLANARATALRAAQIDPRHPGLAGWLRVLGLAR